MALECRNWVACGVVFWLVVTSHPAAAQERTVPPLDLAAGMPHQEEWPPAREMSGHPGRPVTLRDLLSLREIVEQQIAPDGARVAYVIRQADVDSNRYLMSLWVVDTAAGSRPRQLAVGASLSNLRWVKQSGQLMYLAAKEGAAELRTVMDPARARPRTLAHKLPGGLGAFEVAPDGVTLAFIVIDSTTESERRALDADGIVYGPLLEARDLIDKTWVKKPASLVVYSTKSRQSRKLWTAPAASVSSFSAVTWSPDGKRIAVTYRPSDEPHDANNADIGIVNVRDGSFSRLVSWGGFEFNAVWSPNGDRLAFVSQGDIGTRRHFIRYNTIFVSDTGKQEPVAVGPSKSLSLARVFSWTNDGKNILFERSARTTGYVAMASAAGDGITALSDTPDYLSECSASADARVMSCVRQSATLQPDIALVDPRSGHVRALTRLNPQFDEMAVGDVREMRWSNRHGLRAGGFLLLPQGYRAGKAYPLLVMLYGFENKFITQAGWTTFPAQAFSAAGFAALLMNPPPYPPFRWGGTDVDVAALGDRDGPVASIEAAVDTLVALGIADSARIGILGHSLGSYWADLAIARTKLFRAASSQETGGRSPLRYHFGSGPWKYVQRSMFGGPPVGRWYGRYLESSPALMVPPIDVPILREYETRSLDALEYTAWWEQGAQMELVFYPNDDHVFTQPVHRLSSMRRNLDWFNFWLLGVEDPDSTRAPQYARWRAMREKIRDRSSASATAR